MLCLGFVLYWLGLVVYGLVLWALGSGGLGLTVQGIDVRCGVHALGIYVGTLVHSLKCHIQGLR